MKGLEFRKFVPTPYWREVADDEVLPPGCEVRMSMAKHGKTEARLLQTTRPPATPHEVRGRRQHPILWTIAGIIGGLAIMGAVLLAAFVAEQALRGLPW